MKFNKKQTVATIFQPLIRSIHIPIMKPTIILTLLILGCIGWMGFVLSCSSNTNNANNMPIMLEDYGDLWKQLQDQENKGLTEDAEKTANQIYEQAKKDANTPQVIKALFHVYKYMAYKEENSQQKTIDKLNAEIQAAEQPLKSVLQSIMAGVYWQHFQNKRYQILNRTQMGEAAGDDFQTWDATKLTSEISRLYRASIEQAAMLQAIPLNMYDPILNIQDGSKTYRPTLYDLLAHQAVDYFINDAANITKASDQFKLNDKAAFADTKTFVSTQFQNTDELSIKYYAVQTFQELAKFHIGDKDPTALIDTELKRLEFARSTSILSDKDQQYIDGLNLLKDEYAKDAASADVSFKIANYWFQRGAKYIPGQADKYQLDKKRALVVCEETIDAFPQSRGAKNCKYLKERILNPSLQFTIEQASLPDMPFRALVTYANVPKVWGKTVKITPAIQQKMDAMQKEDARFDYINTLEAATTFEFDLPSDDDYQTHSVEIKVPKQELGRYMVLLGTNDKFTYVKNAITYQYTDITKIACISQAYADHIDFYALHRDRGTALHSIDYKIEIEKYDYNTRKNTRRSVGAGQTDDKGAFQLTTNKDLRGTFFVTLTDGDDKYVYSNYLYNRSRQAAPSRAKTFFFTDRSIYRPGQTVHFKGIMIDTDGKVSNILADKKTSIEFMDVNYQKIGSQEFTTNKFGSFSGKFTIPTGVLNGRMEIKNGSGSVSIQVEEYKRPKFEVVFDPVKGSFKLNEKVTITGTAKAYAGAVIDKAAVTYRVVRKASYPYLPWYYYWRWGAPASNEMEITNGTTKTNEKGEYTIEFTAIPDETVAADQKPQYNYTVYADVTDINGETQSDEMTVNVGYVSMLASIDMPDEVSKLGKNEFKVKTTNLAGEHEAADIKVSIHQLKQPTKIFRDRLWSKPDKFIMTKEEYYEAFPYDAFDDENEVQNWEKGKQVLEKSISTKAGSTLTIPNLASLPGGKYEVKLTTKDKYGEAVEWTKYVTLYSVDDEVSPLKSIFWWTLSTQKAQPKETVKVAYGSADKGVKVLYEMLYDQESLKKDWLYLNDVQRWTNIFIKEEHFGNVGVRMTVVKHNRFFSDTRTINVPFSHKDLKVETMTFRNKLYPGQDEEWKIKISGPKTDEFAAEMVAGMYDASLDAFLPHDWNFDIYPRYTYYGGAVAKDEGFNMQISSTKAKDWNTYNHRLVGQSYDNINWFGFGLYNQPYYARNKSMRAGAVGSAPPPMAMESSMAVADSAAEYEMVSEKEEATANGDTPEKPKEEQAAEEGEKVLVRKNLQETAFFMPDLQTNEAGEVLLSFKAPEALTRWNLMGFAHTADLEFGFLNEEVITQKDVMVMPNPPRFFRDGDEIYFSTKISNVSDQDLTGTASLELFDALSMQLISGDMGMTKKDQSFSAKAKQSGVASWKLKIPSDVQAVTYRVIAKAGTHSDGEESSIPVLTNRMLVTETMPLPVRGNQSKDFVFDNLQKSGESSTLQHHKLTLEFTSNPAWYAVQALPYLMEYPYECSEQVFSRYYANSLAAHIANSNPKIKKVFDAWKQEAITASTGKDGDVASAFLSNLEKNQDLKAVLLEETPWVLNAQDEGERKKRVGLLFDLDRMGREMDAALRKLQQGQVSNGGWSWFPGMPESRYITQHIVTGMGNLDNLGVKDIREDGATWDMVQNAVRYLDARIQEDYENLLKYDADLTKDNTNYTQVQYLYARSFFKDIPIASSSQKAVDYYKSQVATHWLQRSKYMQGMIALATHRFENGSSQTAKDIMASLKQNAVRNEEMGMYFKDNTGGYYWYQAPIETQALLIEAFDEVAKDKESVEEMKVWLLKQKQTQDWKTTKATVAACYALLLKGTDFLASDKLARVSLGRYEVSASRLPDMKVEAGTGYFKKSWAGDRITPDMGDINVTNPNDVVAWGGIYWQYFEQLDKITPAETPLTIQKQLFKVENSSSGEKLTPLKDGNTLEIGNKVKVRIEIIVDRDMEYVHLKDMRAAGFEPINVISRYKYQDGLGYYESTKDAATNFFMQWLPKGTYVFEYPLRVSQKGDFSNGITTMQCMYAPEFSSHSEGIRVKVK